MLRRFKNWAGIHEQKRAQFCAVEFELAAQAAAFKFELTSQVNTHGDPAFDVLAVR